MSNKVITQPYNNVDPPIVKKLNNQFFNSPNILPKSGNEVKEQLNQDQPPLGSQFKSYLLTAAPNYWTLDPFQYSVTKFKFSGTQNVPGAATEGNLSPISPLDGLNKISIAQADFKNDPGLIYRDVDFEKLLPAYTATKKSVNDFPSQSYHRFEANDGYFNPNESLDNHDLWYYGADNIAKRNEAGVAGAPLNVQEISHIVFPEPQRGGLDSRNVAKYSWTSVEDKPSIAWGSQNTVPVDNNVNCEFFNYNSGYSKPRVSDFDKVYSFDSNYCRSIGISDRYTGSMPFNPQNIN